MADRRAARKTGPTEAAQALAAAAEAALVDLERRLPAGMGPVQRVEAARIREATQRLLECAAQLATDELMVRGSMGQQRSHPLLKTEQDLRREISDCLQKLAFRAEQRAMLERMNAICQQSDRDGGKEGQA